MLMTQLYLSLKPNDSVQPLLDCIEDIKNVLQLNNEKTEIIILVLLALEPVLLTGLIFIFPKCQGVRVEAWSAHNFQKGSVCVSRARCGARETGCTFQIFTIKLLFILHSTISQICVQNIVKSLHINLWLNQSISF